ncbi:MAG: hypothetical protein NZ533_07980 [Casimicrobiaceae bacterium]|nr:hypothetical protein [Casimicrobiaceae bacterium]MDW8312617.1 hypothetical protein [Burkholderiales bacterium]
MADKDFTLAQRIAGDAKEPLAAIERVRSSVEGLSAPTEVLSAVKQAR